MDMEMMHDMRLSLQLICSSGQLLELTLPEGEGRGYLDMLMQGVEQLGGLLDRALSGQVPREPGPLDVVDGLRTLCLRCSAYAAQCGVRLDFSSNVDALTLVAERDALWRAALNLIMNAIRFSPPNGRVAVRCTALGDFVEIAVADRGRGIPPERLPYIFLRGETDGGAGYGLPSALDGVRRLGGSLSVKAGPGGGTIFTMRLPVRGAMVS